MLDAATAAEIDAQRGALRVQVAAIAAQQAALLEEESRLQQHQGALRQQQEQLAAYLDEKRQRALELAEQVQAARAALNSQRQDHARALAQQTEELAAGRAELDGQRQQLEADRQRAKLLRRRLQRYYQRRLAAERQHIRNREIAVADQQRRMEKEAAKLHQERDALTQARLGFQGDIELGKRQLQAAWQELRQQQSRLQEEHEREKTGLAGRARVLRQREDALADAERVFADAKTDWELKRRVADQEDQGLERRIVSQRQKLTEQERELEAMSSEVRSPKSEVRSPKSEVKNKEVPLLTSDIGHRTSDDAVVELARLADDLADQRLELVEHWQRLALTQQEWEEARKVATDLLEALARDLPQREQALLAGQAALAAAAADLGHRQEELAQFRRHLEGWAARVHLRETTWESQRDRLLADLRGREEAAGKQLKLLVKLRQSWANRRRQELDLLGTERAACEKLRQEYGALRKECWKRALSLEQEQRELSEKTLALEVYQQQFVLRSQDAAAAERRLVRIRKRWLRHNASVMRATAEQFERLQAEAAQWQQRGRDLLKVAEELTHREADLARRQSAWEETLTLVQAEHIKLRQHLESAQAHRERSQRQIAQLQGEVEHLAGVLLDAVDLPASPPAKAA